MGDRSIKKLRHNWVLALTGVLYVLKRPRYLLISAVVAFVISTTIYLVINIGFYGPLFGSSLSIFDKLSLLAMMVQSMVGGYFRDINGVLLLAVSLLQGVTISVLVLTAQRNRELDKNIVGRSGVALVLATIGLGCVPCGTSLLVPIMTLLFSTSAPALLGTANSIVLLGALCLTIYSLHRAGLVAHKYYLAEEK